MSALSGKFQTAFLFLLAVAVTGPVLPATPAAASGPALGAAPAPQEDRDDSRKSSRKKKKEGKETPQAGKKKEDKPFDEVVKDMERMGGLFTFYVDREEGTVLLEIQPDQMDRMYLLSPTVESGIGEGSIGLLAGTVLPEYPIMFHRVGKAIQFLIPNIRYRADDSAEMRRAVANAFSDSLLAQVKLASKPHPQRNSLLVDLSPLFLNDLEGFQQYLKRVYKTAFQFDKDASYFGSLKGFPANVEIEVIHHYKTGEPKPSVTLPDPRNLFLRMRYSLSELPDTGFRPRFADDRVGYFSTILQDYSDDRRETAYVRLAQRWQLEKQDPGASLSPPREPIVFWIENTVPVAYRDALRQGTLLWNQAFEKIGFQDAIVVRQQPDDADWDAADIRYNTLRWIVAPGFGFAQGPSRAHPLTGQLFDADIRFSDDMVRFAWGEYDEKVSPVRLAALLEPPVIDHLGHGSGPRFLCNYAYAAGLQASFGLSLLTARGEFGVDSPEARQYVNDFLIHVTAHEVGHTLGLRHNYKASTIHPVDQLQDTGLTLPQGLTGSVMDYIPVNLAADGAPQGQYWQTTLGPYDYWAIEYGYTPIDSDTPEGEHETLERIAARVAEPGLAYSTDEDTFGFSPRSIDPQSNIWDIGDDPVAYYQDRLDLAQELWDRMEERFEIPGNRYQKFRQVFGQGLTEYIVAALNAPKSIGGIYTHRDHIGDPNGRIPFEPVPVDTQRKALRFVQDYLLAPDALAVPPDLLNKMPPERFWDFQGTPWTLQRLDYPIHDLVIAIQSLVLNRIYNPITMSRIVDQEVKVTSGEDRFTLAEVFAGVRGSVWSEVKAGQNVNSFRRNLQRVHLNQLTRLVLEPAPGTPEDATTLARADLVAIRRAIDRTLRDASIDGITRAHLEEVGARIDATLQAQVQRHLVGATPLGS